MKDKFKFHSYLYKTKKQNKNFLSDSDILAYPKAGWVIVCPVCSASFAFLRVRKINKKIKCKIMQHKLKSPKAIRTPISNFIESKKRLLLATPTSSNRKKVATPTPL